MYKTFVSALIPALAIARGTGDGTSRENSRTNWLINGVESSSTATYLHLHTWNELAVDGTWEWHGDLSA